ncbi:hypothetical protein F2Q68_00034088 [Brassica cretica]|uniref:Transposase MuDR plant domain-containing protein n=2 Tax=Brassica cretica TaxID=69181 RepID=A0ABQ7EJ23_BRACR|nr:hypothetical protein F2Q68_00034088 [Brassica cretica]KAF3596535.1 hypothetical protein DY000_02021484 [Brassica cretica]
MVCEDIEIDINMVNIELSYLLSDLVIGITPPVFITKDRKLKNFLTYVKNKALTRLYDMDGETKLEEEDVKLEESDDDDNHDKDMFNGKSVRFSMVDVMKKGQHFTSKRALNATMEICAMKNNFDYKLGKSDKKVWYVCYADDDCSRHVRAEGLTCYSYFIIKKYVPDHSCAPSTRNNSVRTASSKTVGTLIMHKYESVKEWPKPNDIIQFMRNDHGVEIS